MKKKQYIKPQAEKIISIEFPCLSGVSETWEGYGGPPGAKKNYWDSAEEDDDSRNGFTRVGNFRNKLWDD